MNFSATPDFLPFPNLSCKAHKGGSTGKMLLAASRKLMVPALMGFLFAWDRATATTLQHLWCVSRWSLSHLGGASGFHTLPSQLIQPCGAKGRALSPSSTSLWGSPVRRPEAAGDKSWLSLAKSMSQRWNSFLLQLLEEKVNCSCCSCCSTPHGEA